MSRTEAEARAVRPQARGAARRRCGARRPRPSRSWCGCGTSWEDDAVIRDVATGRYVDRDKPALHRLRRRVLLREGPVDHAAQPAGPPARRRGGDEPDALPVVAALGRRRARRRAGPSPPRTPRANRCARLVTRRRARPRRRSPCCSTSRSLLGLGRGERPPRARRARRPRRARRLRSLRRRRHGGRAGRRDRARPSPAGCRRRHRRAPGAARRPAASSPTCCPGSSSAACGRPVARAATLRERFGLPRPANRFAGADR